MHKLIDDVLGGAALSPDESRIVFRRGSTPQIWIMKTNGEAARKLFDIAPDSAHDARLDWFPDGRRIAFGEASRDGDQFWIRSYDLNTTQTSLILSDSKAGEFCLTGDGRIVYSRLEDPPNDKSANLWEAGIDPRTGRLRGSPRRLTDWPGSLFNSLVSTAGGSRVFFVRLHYQNSVHIGQLLEHGTRLANPRRFSFEQWTNWPTAWSRDSQAVFFNSDSAGHPDIFKQPIEGQNVLALAGSPDERTDARLSPDGKWLLYLAWPPKKEVLPRSGRLMRAAIDGGTTQSVFPVAGYARRGRTDPLVSISAEGFPAFRCPAAPGTPCVLAEDIQGQAVFTAFDPLEGRRGELARIPVSSFTFWDLSPDGRRIAFGANEETSGRIHLLSLSGDPPRDIDVRGWTRLVSAAWSSDGSALFVTAFASKGAPLLRVALDGSSQMLYRGLKYVENPVASPDGRYLAFGEMTEDGNAWLLETSRPPQ